MSRKVFVEFSLVDESTEKANLEIVEDIFDPQYGFLIHNVLLRIS